MPGLTLCPCVQDLLSRVNVDALRSPLMDFWSKYTELQRYVRP
jgi:hypothetical protein